MRCNGSRSPGWRGRHEDAARAARALPEASPLHCALLGWALAEAGEVSAALQVVPAPVDVPPDRAWLVTVTALAHVAALAHDTGAAARLRVLLGAFEGRVAALEGIVAFGPVTAPLAGLASVLGDAEEAHRLRGLATAWEETALACLHRRAGEEGDERAVSAVVQGES